MSREIKVYRSRYDSEGSLILEDEFSVDTYVCEPDEFDQAEGISAADLALEVLNLKIYAEEPSSYPDWQKSTWYSRTEEVYDREEYGLTHVQISAHLENFSDVEALEIYKRFTSR